MKFLLTLALINVSFICSSQEETQDFKRDISIIGGAQLNALDYGKFGIQFRNSLSENWKLKLGGTYDYNRSDNVLENVLVFESDSLEIYRSQTLDHQVYTSRIGLDFELNNYLTFGSELIFGMNSTGIGMYDTGKHLDGETGSWENCYECVYDYHGNIQLGQDFGTATLNNRPYSALMGINKYIVYGLALNIGAKLPIKNRWEIGLFYSPELVRNQLIESTIFYEGADQVERDFDSFTKIHHYADLIVRFKI